MNEETSGYHADAALRVIQTRLSAECKAAQDDRSAYWEHLIKGGSPSNWKLPYGQADDYVTLNNAHRRDLGKHPIPYPPRTEAYVVCEFMLDAREGGWVTPTEVIARLREVGVGYGRQGVQVASMLKDYSLRQAGLALEKVEKPSVSYRLVVVPVEDE